MFATNSIRAAALVLIGVAVLGSNLPVSGIYDARRLLLCPLVSILSLIAIHDFYRKDCISTNSSLAIAGAVIAYAEAVASGLIGSIPFYGWADLHMYVFWGLAIAGIAITVGRHHPADAVRETAWFGFFCALAVLVYGLMTPMGYALYLESGELPLSDFIPHGFISIRYWSHLATWLLPLLPLAARFDPGGHTRKWRGALIAAGGLWYWILWVSMARGSMLSLLLAGVFVALVLQTHAREWLSWQLRAIATALGLWLCLSWLLPELLFDLADASRTVKLTGSGRVELWLSAAGLSMEQFPFGTGPLSWASQAPQFRVAHPHNMYLLWAAEWGWLAMAALGVMVSALLRSWWRASRCLSRQPAGAPTAFVSLSASVFAACMHAGVSAVFIASASMLAGTFVLGYLAGLVRALNRQPGATETPPADGIRLPLAVRLTAITILVGLLAGFAVTNAFFYRAMQADMVPYQERTGRGLAPRYWQHGRFPRMMSDARSGDTPDPQESANSTP